MNKKKCATIFGLPILALLFFVLLFKWNESRPNMTEVASFYISQLQDGDFSCLIDNEIATKKDVSNVYESETMNWQSLDVNKDGGVELVLKGERTVIENIRPIVGIFCFDGPKIQCVFWDVNDSTEILFLGKNGNIIYSLTGGSTYTVDEYYLCEFDKAFQKKIVEGVVVYNFGDGIEVDKERWKESHPELSGMQIEGVHYTKYKPSENPEGRGKEEEISKEEFMASFEKLTGFSFEDLYREFDCETR